MSHYECRVTITFHDRDNYNYYRSSDDYEMVKGDTLESIYEQLAELKRDREDPPPHSYEYTTVDFGGIRHIDVISCDDVDEEVLASTACWKAHMASLEAARQEEEARKASAKEKAKIAQEASERNQLAALKAKYGE